MFSVPGWSACTVTRGSFTFTSLERLRVLTFPSFSVPTPRLVHYRDLRPAGRAVSLYLSEPAHLPQLAGDVDQCSGHPGNQYHVQPEWNSGFLGSHRRVDRRAGLQLAGRPRVRRSAILPQAARLWIPAQYKNPVLWREGYSYTSSSSPRTGFIKSSNLRNFLSRSYNSPIIQGKAQFPARSLIRYPQCEHDGPRPHHGADPRRW